MGDRIPLLPQLLPPSLFSRSTSKLAHPRSHQVEWCVNKQYENKKRQDELSVLKENRNIRNRSQHHLLTRSVKPKRRKEFTRMTRKKGTGLMEEGSVEVQKRRMMNTGRGSAGSARPRTPRIADLEKAGRKGGLAEGEEKAEVKENKLVEPVQTSRLVDGNVWVRKKEVTLTNEMRNLAEWTEKQGEKKEQDKLRMWWKEQSELSDCSDDDGLFEVYKGEGRTDWGRRSILVSLPQPNTLDEIAEPTDSALRRWKMEEGKGIQRGSLIVTTLPFTLSHDSNGSSPSSNVSKILLFSVSVSSLTQNLHFTRFFTESLANLHRSWTHSPSPSPPHETISRLTSSFIKDNTSICDTLCILPSFTATRSPSSPSLTPSVGDVSSLQAQLSKLQSLSSSQQKQNQTITTLERVKETRAGDEDLLKRVIEDNKRLLLELKRVKARLATAREQTTIDIVKFRHLLAIRIDLIKKIDDPTSLNQRIGCGPDCMRHKDLSRIAKLSHFLVVDCQFRFTLFDYPPTATIPLLLVFPSQFVTDHILPFAVDCSPFINWTKGKKESEEEMAVVFQSLVATVKVQPVFDVSLEAKAVRFLESVDHDVEETADDFFKSLASFTDEFSTDIVQSIVVLITSANQVITATSMDLLDDLINCCSAKVHFPLVKADLIPQIIVTLNPHSLSFEEAVDIHASLMKIIHYSLWLATPDCLRQLEIEDRDGQHAVRETVFTQVLEPSEQYMCNSCMNRFSITDYGQSFHFLGILAKLLEISPYYQPTMNFVLSMPVDLTITSCLAYFEKEDSIRYFLHYMGETLREWNDSSADMVQLGRTELRMLRMEGIEDVTEQKLQNEKSAFTGVQLDFYSTKWNRQQGMNR
ncbi:hypothetical protein BLNAU_8404 [Blattamonas nauphoetae]|uniref:Uncharacterized protein n=1 Tax=Blattamonas nauphoetae TaxID=2049346 RepID=A0ABQ9XYL1_9EUKA|nr:hypothetical protein BLNAU_8404 [Blattamonas nauphoetae]